MKNITLLLSLVMTGSAFAALPSKFTELLPFVQPAPNQGESNTCYYVASTGAMELLLNQKDKIKNPKVNGKNDLAESFIIWQSAYWDREVHTKHFIEEVVLRFNYGEAVHNRDWPFKAFNKDGTDSLEAWDLHPNFDDLPRMKVPKVETEFLFSRGKRRYDTYVLIPDDVTTVKEALVKYKAPVIINYNDDGYWHVVLIVGYDDTKKGDCYELEKEECNTKGSFYVRDSNGKKFEARAYNWFLYQANAAAVVKFR